MAEETIFDARTAWRVARAGRLSFLVDAEAYFAAFARAVSRAERTIQILAWDIDSRLRVFRSSQEAGGLPSTMAELLKLALARRPELEIHVLSWKPAAIYTFEREFFQTLKLEWLTDDRLHFRIDDNYPPHTSLHEKIVVVDDAVAFIGGIDLTIRRWDTPGHEAEHPDRVSPHGDHYRPFHDVQAVVSGELAAALGDHARERWRRATGETLRPPPPPSGDPWPVGIEPEVRDVQTAIVRTMAAWQDRPQVLETERFYQRALQAARRSIYIENQYVGSYAVRDALAGRLEDDEPPEVVIVSPKDNSGWLETATMGALRAKLIQRLLRTNAAGTHFRAVYPVKDGDISPNVHSKLVVVDDRFAYVGSANLSNRSLRIDHEVGLGFDALGRGDLRRVLASLRDRLLAEHLGVGIGELRSFLAANPSLVRAVDQLGGGVPGVRPLETDLPEWAAAFASLASVADPEEVVTLERIVNGFFRTVEERGET